MKTLVIGSGGREHALAWKLSQETEVIAAPGNPGIAAFAECLPIASSDATGLIGFAQSREIELVVIGPEDPLIDGLADRLREAGLAVLGPGAAGAQLEGSKAWSKELMSDAGIPTADFQVFTHPEPAHAYVDSRIRPIVVKASGAALGKGVVVCAAATEAHEAVDHMLVEQAFGSAGQTIVIEDRLNGPEFSLLTLCSDHGYLTLPVAQDYKRALDGDRGPNTGGMGTYSPVPKVSTDLVRRTEKLVVEPVLNALRAKGITYRGVLFSGLMLHDGEPYCLEFNVRFGDPETQSVVRRLGTGFAEALLACAKGEEIPPIDVRDNAAVTVVLASGGYPGTYAKGLPIEIGSLPDGVVVFHAGTKMDGERLVTSGGRVLAVSAEAADLSSARDLAYEAAGAVHFEGASYRRDIAAGI